MMMMMITSVKLLEIGKQLSSPFFEDLHLLFFFFFAFLPELNAIFVCSLAAFSNALFFFVGFDVFFFFTYPPLRMFRVSLSTNIYI